MKSFKTVIFAGLSILAFSAHADFETLPNDGSRIFGSNDISLDDLFIDDGGLIGDGTCDGSPAGECAVDPVSGADIFLFNLPSNLVLLDEIETEIELPDEDDPTIFEEVGELIDAVFQDTNDGTLVFGLRFEVEAEETATPGVYEWAEAEINDFYRSGMAGYGATVGWTRATSADLRMFSAAHSETSGVDAAEGDPEVYNPDIVTMQSDINGEEGNAYSGWYLVKTTATAYQLATGAVSVYQAGEEDQDPYLVTIDGFAPVPVPAAVWLFGSALIGLVGVGRRNKK